MGRGTDKPRGCVGGLSCCSCVLPGDREHGYVRGCLRSGPPSADNGRVEVAFSKPAFRYVARHGGSCYVWLEDISAAFWSLRVSTAHPPGAAEFRLEQAWHPREPFAHDGIDVHVDAALEVPFLSVGLRRFPRRRLDVAWSLERPNATDFLAWFVPQARRKGRGHVRTSLDLEVVRRWRRATVRAI